MSEDLRPVESMSIEEMRAVIFAWHIAERVQQRNGTTGLMAEVIFQDVFAAARTVLTVAFSSADPAQALAEIDQLEESMKE
jgi:hypothetical protein